MKIGVYVGSFNPVHKGHKFVINYLLENNYLDKIIIISTRNYWDKDDLIDLEHRVNMLKFYESDKIIINCELSDKEYTYEVLDEFQENCKDIATLDDLLEHIERYNEELEKNLVKTKENRDALNMITFHGSKGLEFRVVFILDANEGITPYKKAVVLPLG